MMLIDSNIIIYASQTEHSNLRQFIADNSPLVSAVSYVEVLGFHRLTVEDKTHFEEFFAACYDSSFDTIGLKSCGAIATNTQNVAGRFIDCGDLLVWCIDARYPQHTGFFLDRRVANLKSVRQIGKKRRVKILK